MSLWRNLRRVTRVAIVLAIGIGLISSVSWITHPQTAQAQSCTGGGYSIGCAGSGYGGCGSSYGGGSYFGSSSFYSGCSGFGSTGCGGLFNSTPCTGAGFNGAACTQTLFQNGANCTQNSCVGKILQLGQSCSNGVITCSPPAAGPPVPCGSGPTSYCPPNAPPTQCGSSNCQPNVSSSLCPAGYQQPAPRANLPVSAGAENVTCPGGGFASSAAACSSGSAPSTSSSSDSGQSSSALGASGTNLTGATSGFTVSYAAGWNIVAGPAGTTLTNATGSLFTLQPGDTNYETANAGTPLKVGAGYWIDLPSAAQSTISNASPPPMTVQLPAGQWVMLGNPGSTTATVSGADTVLTYDPVTGYNQTTQLQPGQGALAISYSGGVATISNAPLGQSALMGNDG